MKSASWRAEALIRVILQIALQVMKSASDLNPKQSNPAWAFKMLRPLDGAGDMRTENEKGISGASYNQGPHPRPSIFIDDVASPQRSSSLLVDCHSNKKCLLISR